MKLSIVIPTRNEPLLENCLKSVKQSEGIEVIIVFNGCSPDYITKNRKIGSNFSFPVIFEELPEPNIAVARNRGAELSRGEFLLFMDADCTFKEGCIEKILKATSDYEVIKGRVIFEKRTFWSNLVKEKWKILYTQINRIKFFTPNLTIKKELFLKTGGFDPFFFYSEDVEYALRLSRIGVKYVYLDEAVVIHKAVNFIADFKRHFFIGQGAALLRKKYGRNFEKRFSFSSLKKEKSLLFLLRRLLLDLPTYAGYLFQLYFKC